MSGAAPEGFTVCHFGAADEVLHTPSEHESHNESVYFEWTVPGGPPVVGGVVRIGMRPNQGYSEMSLVLPLASGAVVFHYARTPLEVVDLQVGSGTWAAGGMTLAAVEPTRRWRVAYASDEARLVEDREAFAAAPGQTWRASRTVRCELELAWEADFPTHVLSADGDLMPGDGNVTFGKSHYEQFGRLDGTMRLDDEEWAIESAPGFRDHSWGPRIWESAPDQDFVTVYLDDGRRMTAVCNRPGPSKEDSHGICWLPGASAPVPLEGYEIRTSYAGEPLPASPIGWTFATADDEIVVDGDVVASMPLRLGKGVRLAQTIVRCDGPVGGFVKVDLLRPLPAD